ncbi:HET-domain-containing protein [Hypoxylon sp. FL0543]|nr:HET-domain-containing protein [Hypoxylon sp. FL0543]
MVRYRYSPLPGKDYIRLATIHPGRFEDDVVVSLQTSLFPRDGSLRYEALSYTWGSRKNRRPVHVSRCDITTTTALRSALRMKFERILTRQNLVVALRHLRYVDKPRVIWVDALCINQADEVEKGPQVAMMGEIFRLAHRVVAWLGPEENDSTHAMELMDHLGSEVDVDFVYQTLIPADGCTDPSLSDLDAYLRYDKRLFSAAYHLISRKWFDRLWIRQEIHLANPEAIILCGFCQVKWTNFRRGLACLYKKSYRVPSGVNTGLFNGRKRALEGFIFQVNTTLIELRLDYGNSHCTDPQDRLYAVLSLLPECERALIPQPDYTRPYDELYQEVALRWIEYYRSLDLLSYCDLQNSVPFPSWVPDWSTPSKIVDTVGTLLACSQLSAYYDFPKPEVLRVVGAAKAKVEKYHQIPHLDNTSRDVVFEEIRRLLLKVQLEKRHTVEELARTITRNCFADSYDPPHDRRPDLDTAKKLVELMLSDYEFDRDDFQLSSPYRTALKEARVIRGARLIVTTDGYLGIAPASAEPGDVVCVILGCSTPLLLRPLGNGEFRLVGPCFVAGLANGEGLLGPLPENIRVVIAIDEDGKEEIAFKDALSGEIFHEDPRLKSLPVDLTDFRQRLSEDPNSLIYIEPKILREHGVDLEYFDIV